MKREQIPVKFYAAALKAKSTPLVLTAEEKDGKAVIRIVGGIYEWENSSNNFRAEIDEMKARGIKDVHVYIKSGGGDPIEASEISNIIASFEGTITGEGGSVVASAASYIACKIKGFTMAKNGQFMYHKPMISLFGQNEDEVTSSLKRLQDITKDYAQVYSDVTGKTVEAIGESWGKGDVWMTAKEAAAEKFISGVSNVQKITAEDSTMLAACGAPNVPVIEKKINKNENMKLSAIALVKMGLTASATEQEIEDKISELTANSARLVTFEAKAKNDAKDARVVKIKAVVDKAIAEKKFTEDYRSSFSAKLEANFDAASKEIEEMKAVPKMSGNLDLGDGSELTGERKNWTYADFQTKDAEALNKMPKENPEAFKALFKAEYGEDAPAALFEA